MCNTSKQIFACIACFGLVTCANLADFTPESARKLNRQILSRLFDKPQQRIPTIQDYDRTAQYPKVNTTSGTVVGITTEKSHAFYQIPYAKPPVEEMRWKDPEPLQPMSEDINATLNTYTSCYQHRYENIALSTCDEDVQDVCPLNENEDCLLLNVYVPVSISLPLPPSVSDGLLPVMFYIHGGSFKTGSGTKSQLDGKELANVTNTVVVTINYRLGALGFLTLDEDGMTFIEGNQGFKDQRLALGWVQDNINNFGGDKNQVTIFGNSAGAQSVMLHTVSSKSKDLYHAAIQQSNPAIYSFYFPSTEAALRISRRLIEELKCNGTSTSERECLMAKSPEDIMAMGEAVELSTATEEGAVVYDEETFMPIVDGVYLVDQPMELFRRGKWNKDKNMIIGINTEESLDFQFYAPDGFVMTKDHLLYLNLVFFGPYYGPQITQKYMDLYPPQDGQDYKETYATEVSHYYFDCPSKLMARLASNTSQEDVYFYINSHPVLLQLCVDKQGGNETGCKLAYHASEIRYVFRTVLENEKFTADDRIVENEFSTYWGSFARTLNPSNNLETPVGNYPTWPPYRDIEIDEYQPWSHIEITAPTSQTGFRYNDDICAFWESINFARRENVESTTEKPVSVTGYVESTTSNGNLIKPIACLYVVCCIIVSKIGQ